MLAARVGGQEAILIFHGQHAGVAQELTVWLIVAVLPEEVVRKDVRTAGLLTRPFPCARTGA